MTKNKFKELCLSKNLTMADLKSMTPKQRMEMRKDPLRYVTDADVNGNPDFLGAFIREIINPKGGFRK